MWYLPRARRVHSLDARLSCLPRIRWDMPPYVVRCQNSKPVFSTDWISTESFLTLVYFVPWGHPYFHGPGSPVWFPPICKYQAGANPVSASSLLQQNLHIKEVEKQEIGNYREQKNINVWEHRPVWRHKAASPRKTLRCPPWEHVFKLLDSN